MTGIENRASAHKQPHRGAAERGSAGGRFYLCCYCAMHSVALLSPHPKRQQLPTPVRPSPRVCRFANFKQRSTLANSKFDRFQFQSFRQTVQTRQKYLSLPPPVSRLWPPSQTKSKQIFFNFFFFISFLQVFFCEFSVFEFLIRVEFLAR